MNRSDRAFHDLLGYIERELDFESGFYNDAYLDRRITARMRRTGHDESSRASCSSGLPSRRRW